MSGAAPQQEAVSRRFPRFAIDVRITVHVYRALGTESFWGRTSELGEDGVGGTLTGEIEPGETFEDAAVREMQEETGVTVAARRVFGADQPGDMPGDERSIAARAPHAECGRTVRQCCSYHPRGTPVVMLAHEFCERHSCCKRLYSRDQLSQPVPSPSRSKP